MICHGATITEAVWTIVCCSSFYYWYCCSVIRELSAAAITAVKPNAAERYNAQERELSLSCVSVE